MNNLLKRLKNKGTLLAVLAWVYSILEMYKVLNLVPDNFWEVVVLGAVNILVILGIVNDPTTEDTWYRDDNNDGIDDNLQ